MKLRLAIVTFVILALAVPLQMLAQQNSKAETEIRAVIAQSDQANLKGGAEAVAIDDKILTDDYTRIPPNGAALTKADIQNAFKAGHTKYDSLQHSDVKVRIYGHTAVVTGVATEKGIRLGASFSGKTRWTRVFVKQGGDWKIVLFQSTTLAEPAKQ